MVVFGVILRPYSPLFFLKLASVLANGSGLFDDLLELVAERLLFRGLVVLPLFSYSPMFEGPQAEEPGRASWRI